MIGLRIDAEVPADWFAEAIGGDRAYLREQRRALHDHGPAAQAVPTSPEAR